jgi:hypothetical protein
MVSSLQSPTASVATVTASAISGKSATGTPIGVDIGNGALKLVSSQGETRIDSYLHYLSERASMSVHSGYVEYHSGDRSDLVGKQWIGGLNAYYHGLRAIYRVTDTPHRKS